VQLPDSRAHIEDQVERLGDDDAVECLRREHSLIGKIADDRHVRAGVSDMQHVLPGNRRPPEALRVSVFANFQNSPPDVG